MGAPMPITPTPDRTLLLACGALARELQAVIGLNGWDHVDLHCLPAQLHNTPEKIPDALEAAVTARRGDYAAIKVVYADCGTGGLLQSRCAELGVDMLEGPHCYSFFEGNEVFAARGEMTAFYLTDFLVRQFDAFVTRPLGLDRIGDLLGRVMELCGQAMQIDVIPPVRPDHRLQFACQRAAGQQQQSLGGRGIRHLGHSRCRLPAI